MYFSLGLNRSLEIKIMIIIITNLTVQTENLESIAAVLSYSSNISNIQ